MNILFPGIGSAVVEAFYALKEAFDILKDLYTMATLITERIT